MSQIDLLLPFNLQDSMTATQRLRTVGIAGRTRADRRKSVTAPDGPGPHDGLRSEVKRS